MSEAPRAGRRLVVAVVWIGLALAAALLWRFVFVPAEKADAERERVLAEYAELTDQARTRGVEAAPPESLADADLEAIVAAKDALLLALTGAAPVPNGAGETVSVGLDAFSGYAIFRSPELARELRAVGLSLRLEDDGADYAARFRALAEGRLDLALFTVDALLAAMHAQGGRAPGTIVLVVDESVGADALVAHRSGVPGLDALAVPEARFVLVPGSPSELLARIAMANFDLAALPERPFITRGSAADVHAAFRDADPSLPRAYALWEPYVAKALEVPGAHVLLDSAALRGSILDVLVAERNQLARREGVVRRFVEAYLRAARALLDDPARFRALIVEDARAAGEPLTDAQATRLAQGVWWKNTVENYAHFGLAGASTDAGLRPLDRIVLDLDRVLRRTGAIPREAPPTDPALLRYDGVLAALARDGFHPGVGGARERARADAAPRPLSDAEWSSLVPLGTLAVDRIVFARGTARLTDAARAALADLARALESFPFAYLEVRGNALKRGDPEANRRLATERADAVAAELRALGVPEARLRAVVADDDRGEQAVSFVLGQRPY